ncbi:response regulator [Mesorhizobium sp. M0074]|uniref:response regulator n=1 Tax=Mesorhizobium sp. M0074 TaxID=2956869 RepID=UPI00333A096A
MHGSESQISTAIGRTGEEPESFGERPLRFRRFCVLPRSRVLLCDGRPVPIGSRAFDLLTALLRVRGTIVEKNGILKCVWPSTIVDDSNLRFQMAALRRVLGSDGDMIKTIPGRGYLFADDDVTENPAPPPMEKTSEHETVPEWLRLVPSPEAPSRTAAPYVAVVDDEPEIREALVGLIESAGLCAEAFPSVRAFLDSDRPSPPSCLVLDAWLPEHGGLDFQADLAKAKVRLPLIFISGHADVAMSVRAMKAGAIEFLTKPVRHEELLNAIKFAMAADIAAFRPGSPPEHVRQLRS